MGARTGFLEQPPSESDAIVAGAKTGATSTSRLARPSAAYWLDYASLHEIEFNFFRKMFNDLSQPREVDLRFYCSVFVAPTKQPDFLESRIERKKVS
jgi:hypothetical protein